MITVVETLNAWSEAWADLVWAVVWQSALIAAVIAFVAFLLRRSSPALRTRGDQAALNAVLGRRRANAVVDE